MSYQATVFKVMVAAPRDVDEERQIAREVISEWNDIHSENKRVVLLPVDWQSHSYPEMGERPQEKINSQVLKRCDLLVAVFWTRLGTPTGKAKSGTVEEIEKHEAAGKPVMIYFSNAPIEPGKVDKDQYQAVVKFKKRCLDKGLTGTYKDKSEFRGMLTKQLCHMLINNEYFVTARSLELPADSRVEQPVSPQLSSETEALITEAAEDEYGRLVKIDHMGAQEIQTNGKRFGGANPQERALWQRAFDELLTHKLIVQGRDSHPYYDVFYLTTEGFEVAENLKTSD